ncbi:MAG: hypothetical protein M3Y86_07810 [Verrucomicrobiota bacterium]|nr:hypothetical protein [Verrucomicrobiota bacterium]
MQLANPIRRRNSVFAAAARNHTFVSTSPQAAAELHAYIAIRDELFAEAEQTITPAKLESALVANDFVATYLRPARAPYAAQSLPENDAVRERTRCEFVRGRLAQLRMLVAPSAALTAARA